MYFALRAARCAFNFAPGKISATSLSITSGFLPSALRASLWLFKIVPHNFVSQ
jgi:hypothetical protein